MSTWQEIAQRALFWAADASQLERNRIAAINGLLTALALIILTLFLVYSGRGENG